MKSIKSKVMISILACSLTALLIVGIISAFISKNILEEYAYDSVALSAESHAKTLNQLIGEIESSVNSLSIVLLEMIEDTNQFQSSHEYVSNYQEKIRPIVKQFAENTRGASTFYVRFNPDFTEPTSGLFHADLDGDGDIEALTPTDFSQYDPADVEHVGWYYTPIEAGKPVWLGLYHNENIDVDMVSYVVPLTKEGVTIGVVGMDINFSVFTELVNHINPYENSYGALTNHQLQFLIHPQYTKEQSINEVSESLAQQVLANENGISDVNTEFGKKVIAHSRLSNGDYLLIETDQSVLFADVQRMILIIICVSIGMIIVSILVASVVGRIIKKPLSTLVKDMNLVQQGDLTVRTVLRTNDETRMIGDNFNDMVSELARLTKNMGQVTAQIEGLSDSLQLASQTIIQGSEKATASVQEIATGSRIQAGSIENCSDIAGALSQQSNELKANTDHAMVQVEQMQNRKDRSLSLFDELTVINRSNNEASAVIDESIHALARKANNVTEIIEQIQHVAAQTKILALNASIESARAGEAGKGFAVVASEIRKLADQSNESASQIYEILTDIHRDSLTMVDNLKIVQLRNTERTEAVGQVNEAFHHISYSIGDVAESLKTNASYIKQVESDAQVLAKEIVEIAAISEESSAASEDVAATVHAQAQELEHVGQIIAQLNGLVADLKEQMSRFKL